MLRQEINYKDDNYLRISRARIRKGNNFPRTLYVIPSDMNVHSPWSDFQVHTVEDIEDFERLDNELNYYIGSVFYYEKI